MTELVCVGHNLQPISSFMHDGRTIEILLVPKSGCGEYGGEIKVACVVNGVILSERWQDRSGCTVYGKKIRPVESWAKSEFNAKSKVILRNVERLKGELSYWEKQKTALGI